MNSQRAILDKIQELTEKISRARDMALDGDFDATDFKAVKQDCENQIAALEANLPDVIQATRNVQDNLEKAFAKMGRSEEHTSELQSLMRSSYAVICVKNKQHCIHNPKHLIK